MVFDLPLNPFAGPSGFPACYPVIPQLFSGAGGSPVKIKFMFNILNNAKKCKL
jgi:hypothetical protein